MLIVITMITLLALSLKILPELTQTWAHISVIVLVVPFILIFIVFIQYQISMSRFVLNTTANDNQIIDFSIQREKAITVI